MLPLTAPAVGVTLTAGEGAFTVLTHNLVPGGRHVAPLQPEMSPVDGAEGRPPIRDLDVDAKAEAVQVDLFKVVADHVELGDRTPLIAIELAGDG
jgi:hypothetical protein